MGRWQNQPAHQPTKINKQRLHAIAFTERGALLLFEVVVVVVVLSVLSLYLSLSIFLCLLFCHSHAWKKERRKKKKKQWHATVEGKRRVVLCCGVCGSKVAVDATPVVYSSDAACLWWRRRGFESGAAMSSAGAGCGLQTRRWVALTAVRFGLRGVHFSFFFFPLFKYFFFVCSDSCRNTHTHTHKYVHTGKQ